MPENLVTADPGYSPRRLRRKVMIEISPRELPQRDITDAEAAVGIADHIFVSPKADAAIPAAQQVGNNRPTAGQAYLPTMRMATKIETVSRSCGVIGDFRGMDKRNPK